MFRNQTDNQDSLKPKVELISEDNLQEKDKDTRVMSVSAIPDVTELSNQMIAFLEFYDRPDVVKMRKHNYANYLNSLYDNFSTMPASMISLLSDEENRVMNLAKLINMLETLGQVKKGNKNIEEECNKFIENNNEEYFYPAFGGKDKLIKDIESKGGKIDLE